MDKLCKRRANANFKYQYIYLKQKQTIALQNTNLEATAYELDHVKPYRSSAALIHDKNKNYIFTNDNKNFI